jgi:hypothetical protein
MRNPGGLFPLAWYELLRSMRRSTRRCTQQESLFKTMRWCILRVLLTSPGAISGRVSRPTLRSQLPAFLERATTTRATTTRATQTRALRKHARYANTRYCYSTVRTNRIHPLRVHRARRSRTSHETHRPPLVATRSIAFDIATSSISCTSIGTPGARTNVMVSRPPMCSRNSSRPRSTACLSVSTG